MTRWGKVSFFCKRFSCIFSYPKPVISSGGSMPYDSTTKNRYSFEEPRNLSCVRDYRSFPHDIRVVTPSQPFTREISRLFLTYDSYNHLHSDAYLRSKWRRRDSVTIAITVFQRDDFSRSPVISSGGSMRHDTTVKNRYSSDESRNLSCVREYRSFPHDIRVVTPSQASIWEISRLSLTYDSYGYTHHGAYLRSKWRYREGIIFL